MVTSLEQTSFSERPSAGHDVDILHHLGLISPDLAALSACYEGLGFTLSPVSVPQIPLRPGSAPESLGVGNRCAIFRENYLELLGVVDAARWASITPEQRGPFDIDRPMRRYVGLHVLHLGADDLEIARARLLKEGMAPSEIRPFQRPVDTIDGPKMMRAKAMSFTPGSTPEALMQIAQHETPELVLQPRYMTHANGARAIVEVVICTDDVAETTRRYAGYAGKPAHRTGPAVTIDLGRSRVVIVDPDHLDEVMPGQRAPTLPYLAGFAVASDLQVTRAFLDRNAIPYSGRGGRVTIDAALCFGTAIQFTQD